MDVHTDSASSVLTTPHAISILCRPERPTSNGPSKIGGDIEYQPRYDPHKRAPRSLALHVTYKGFGPTTDYSQTNALQVADKFPTLGMLLPNSKKPTGIDYLSIHCKAEPLQGFSALSTSYPAESDKPAVIDTVVIEEPFGRTRLGSSGRAKVSIERKLKAIRAEELYMLYRSPDDEHGERTDQPFRYGSRKDTMTMDDLAQYLTEALTRTLSHCNSMTVVGVENLRPGSFGLSQSVRQSDIGALKRNIVRRYSTLTVDGKSVVDQTKREEAESKLSFMTLDAMENAHLLPEQQGKVDVEAVLGRAESRRGTSSVA